jgi:2-polyprenyl-6-hydroxyphenyl methylase/3-demethylubiquinone-9 3-methyltransferase
MNDLTIYDTWAPRWWDGSARWLRTLHNMVPARLAYFETVISSWDGLNVLDLGCGGGFMSDALAQRGAKVIGFDPSVEAIGAARRHAAVRHFDIDYRIGVGETLDLESNSIDVVVCVDVLEHLASVPDTLDQITRVLRPGGTFVFDTINRNVLSRFLVVTMAENVLSLLPRGAHDPNLFIKPSELERELYTREFENISFSGLGPTGLNNKLDFTFGRVPTTLVQYMGTAQLRTPPRRDARQ